MSVLSEETGVEVHQFGLSDGGGDLLGGNIAGMLAPSESCRARADRAGRDEDNLVPGILQIRKHAGQPLDASEVEFSVVICQRAGADLDDNTTARA